ncbi:hypothetical protein HXX76_005567 [Chlamydomonas incerta]|uniref:Ubiquitin-like domain-containing protein n=1 Tax=Chlamydomonas incerta TaxID=51695 RepID=A0A835W2A9_CHLIN|nr:hypothetical protein HXX76_005567 [Chlamydomonas incerta]|eukprot:KAG2437952.1 hypothetical protein HXX76_005567 [Chlamydomonas incerta]
MSSGTPETGHFELENCQQQTGASPVAVGVSLFCPGEAPRHGQLMVTSQTTVGDVRKYLRDVLGVPADRQKWVSLQRVGRGGPGGEAGGGSGGGLASAFGGMGCEAVMLLDNSRTLDSYGVLTADTEIHAAAAPPRSTDGTRGPRMQPGVPWGNAAPACPVMVLLPSGKLAALQRLSVDSKYEMLEDVMCDSSGLEHSLAFDGSELTTAGVPLRNAPNIAPRHTASSSANGGGGGGGGYVQTLGGGSGGGGAAGAAGNGSAGGGGAAAAAAAVAATTPTGELVPGAQGDSTGSGPGSGAVATPTTYGRDGRPVELTVAASYCY